MAFPLRMYRLFDWHRCIFGLMRMSREPRVCMVLGLLLVG